MFGLAPGDRVLVVAPHSDNETLDAGGTHSQPDQLRAALDPRSIDMVTAWDLATRAVRGVVSEAFAQDQAAK